MAKKLDPDYVAGSKPPYKIQPPIRHPKFCVCRRCSRLPAEERTEEHVFRILRASPYPTSRVQTSAHALTVKRQLERELVALREGTVRGRITLEALFSLFFEANPAKVSDATIRRDRISAANLIRLIDAGIPPDEIDEPIVIRYRNVRESEGAAPRTILSEMSFLKRILEFGLRWQRETGMTGVRYLEVPQVGEWDSPGVALTEGEVSTLLAIARPREKALLVAGITTMLRRMPLLALQQAWVDLDAAWLSVPSEFMKKGKSRRRYPLEVPLSGWTVDVLREITPTGGYYWPSSKSGRPMRWIEHILEELLAKANTKDKVRAFSMHDLRTTGASWLRAAKVDELVIGILLGHRGVFEASTGTFHERRGANVTQGYTKLFEPTLREAVAVFDGIRTRVTK